MKTYELTYIITPEITSEEAEAKGKEIETLVSGKEGTILKQITPSAKTLSYPIGKHASGFFGILEFNVEAEKVPEIDAVMQKDGKIARHMIIIKEPATLKKERRTRGGIKTKPAPFSKVEEKAETEPTIKEKVSAKSSEKEKVELKDIEQKLDEILGE